MINREDIFGYHDTLDSRDVLEYLEELRDLEDPNEQDIEDLKELESLDKELQGYSDYSYGIHMIRESYFREYAMELAYDCGMVPDDLSWPLTCIDWNQATEELKMDYGTVEFDGSTWYVQ